MAFSTINTATPSGTDKKKFGDDIIRELKTQTVDNLKEITNYPAGTKPALRTAVWTTATRPTGDELVDRITGFNTTLGYEEYYDLTSATWKAKNTTVSSILSTVYPVGSIYMSVSGTSPATLFGGTWVQIQNVFLLAAGSSYAAGSTGGEATHILTSNEMPNHAHSFTAYRANGANHLSSVGGNSDWDYASGIATSAAGGNAAHNNMPPYLAVYMWKRTA